MDPNLQALHSRFEPYLPQIEAWIDDYLAQSAAEARSVASLNFPRLPLYFCPETLNEARVVTTDRIQNPPLSQLGLSEFADFERMDPSGITYKNTYFIKAGRVEDESLHFHELIHVLQWRVAGPKNFMLAYAAGLAKFGYQDSPLEVMAYDQQERFDTNEIIPNLEKIVKNMTEAIVGNPLQHPFYTMMRRIQVARGTYAPEFNAEIQEVRRLKVLSRAADGLLTPITLDHQNGSSASGYGIS